MLDWFLYAILGTAVYTVVCFVDKYNLEKQIKDYRGMAMYSAIVGLLTGTVLWALTGFPLLGLSDGLLVLITGVLYIWAAAIYFFVMQRESSQGYFSLSINPRFYAHFVTGFSSRSHNFKAVFRIFSHFTAHSGYRRGRKPRRRFFSR